MRPKSTIYTPKRDDEHPVTSIRDPPPPPYHHHRGLHPELTIETPTLKLYFTLTW